jgi:hypothetical protein
MTEENEGYEYNSCIRGAFILAQRISHKKLAGYFLVKICSINLITDKKFSGDDSNQSIFYTYKDCCYYAEICPIELRRAINSFIFEQDKHLEIYPE